MENDNHVPIELILQFNESLNHRDVTGMMGRMSEDCVFENTEPPPDGTRYEGQSAVRTFWEEFFRGSQSCRIDIEDIFGCAGRYTMLWTYSWVDLNGQPGHVRGVDVYTIREGLIAEKLSYVKG